MPVYFEAKNYIFWAATKSARRVGPESARVPYSERELRSNITLAGRPAIFIFPGVSYIGHPS